MKRIFVIGVSGSGKTTLAAKLSKKLNREHLDKDDAYWLPGCIKRSTKEHDEIIDDFTKKDKWVISGNSSDLSSPIWRRCDTVIWLDYGILRCCYRSILRTLRRIKNSEECCGGNYESLSRFLSKNSILVWSIASFKKRQRVYGKIFSSPGHKKQYIRLKAPRETESWFRKLR
jgi:adenylate kinase family enzyme